MNLVQALASDIDLVSALHLQNSPDDGEASSATATATATGTATAAYNDADADATRRFDLLLIIFVTAATIGTYHNCMYFILRTIFPASFHKNRRLFKKGAYQGTNMTVNLILGLYGIYHYCLSVPRIDAVSITERIRGFPEFAIFGALQTGYNVWALPVGLTMNEPPAMIAHHIAVLCVGSLSCFSIHGFRYHAPFFFGVIEISSVPLSIMNFCKDQSHIMTHSFPLLCATIRHIFAITFLLVRVILWSPQMLDVLRISGLLGYTCPTGDHVCRTALGSFWLSAFFLTMLQFFWGSLVVKGIFNSVIGTTSASTRTSTSTSTSNHDGKASSKKVD